MNQTISIAQAKVRAGCLCAIVAIAGVILPARPTLTQERPSQTPSVLLDASLSEVLQDAVAAVGRSDWSAAARLYREAIAIAPGEAALYNNLGVIERRRGNLDAAIVAYRQTLDIDPTFGEVYPNLAIALLATEQWQAALDTIALASDSNVFEPLLPLYRALAHEKLLQWEDAAEAYDLYVQSEPNALGYYRGAIAHW
ncbi:MAG: tetratricopeptide repeat protein, partial [Cyanobacteria bacterium J06648_11]